MRTPLPVDEILPELLARLSEASGAVLVAPPGSGKTTRAPAALLALGGRVLLLQPRRVAARLAARRIAEELGVEVGAEVGYRVRFENRTSAATRLEILTEGLLLRRLQADPFLEGVSAVVLDEFHERSLDLDLALAMLREVQASRPDLRMLVMSATLDPEPVAAFLGGVPVLRAEGRRFPVKLLYDPPALRETRRVAERCADAIRQVRALQPDGHVLAFLPGLGEIRATAELLSDLPEVHLLHSSSRAEDQDRALSPSRTRKVVLATNIAETSVTLEGVTAVVDTGLRRAPRFDPVLGLSRLELGMVSEASAEQRAGRAGRTGPGICRRLWSESAQRGLRPFDEPEIETVDLARAALELSCWGADPRRFSWFQAPPTGALETALELLHHLGALDRAGVTARGRQMLDLPLHPRLAAVVLEGARLGIVAEAAAAAVLASERDPWMGTTTPVDLDERVAALLDDGAPAARSADRGALRSARQITESLLRAAPRASRRATDHRALALALLAGFPDRVARRRAPDSPGVRLVGGAGAILDVGAAVGAELVLAVVLEGAERKAHANHRVRAALSLELDWLPKDEITEIVIIEFDAAREAVVARRVRAYRDLPLSERAVEPPDPQQTAEILAAAAAARPERAIKLDEADHTLLARLRFLARAMPELDLAAPNPAAMLPDLCFGLKSFAELARIDWRGAFMSRLTAPQRAALERAAPTSLPVPSGANVPLSYPEDGPPVLAARVQQLFGMAASPRLAGVPVLIHLLSPAGRPVQVTGDLASFWANTYSDVRRDLRGRYPRHSWPEDPYTAIPEDRPRRRRETP